MDVYDRIELRAKALGISKAHISTTMGMTRTWLNSAQSYQTFLPPETVERIAAILHTTPECLRGETDNPDIKKDPQSSKAAAMERIHNIGKASKGKNAASDGENE